jgi:hypothetical protein
MRLIGFPPRHYDRPRDPANQAIMSQAISSSDAWL